MGYCYNQRILVVPRKGFEEDYKEFKDLLEKCVEEDDFSEIEGEMCLECYDAYVDNSEDFFVETTDEYCQFFITAPWASEGFTLDALHDLVSTYNVCAYSAFSEQDDFHDGSGIGFHYLVYNKEYDEMETESTFCFIDENGINDGTCYSNGELPFEPDSEDMERMLYRMGCLAWDKGYMEDDDSDYYYDSSSDALKCFKKILSDLKLVTENPKVV